MIKALIFDLGNVVLTSDMPYNTLEELSDFCRYFGTTLDNLELAMRVAFLPYSLGRYSEQEFWERYLYAARAKKMDISHAKKLYRRNQKENEHMLSLLSKLRRKVRLAALSTIPKEWLEFKRKKFKLDAYFDYIVSSGEYRIEKPNPEIYKIIIKKMKLKPSEMIFTDDSEGHLVPAEKLGMETILFRGQKDLEARLNEMLK